nr:MAG TPA: hypothetical protein [Caudoviricetes sp.]
MVKDKIYITLLRCLFACLKASFQAMQIALAKVA